MSEELKPVTFIPTGDVRAPQKGEWFRTVNNEFILSDDDYRLKSFPIYTMIESRESQLEQALLQATNLWAAVKAIQTRHYKSGSTEELVHEGNLDQAMINFEESLSALNLGEKEKEKDGENKSVDEAVRRYENNGE